MGLKYTPDEYNIASDPLSDESSIGQLQVHIVEGAGFVDEETRKPFNTFVKWYAWRHTLYMFIYIHNVMSYLIRLLLT